MKKLYILIIAALPLAALAGPGDREHKKPENVNINIHTDKNGAIEITGLNDKELKELQTELNKALKNVNFTINNGNEKYEVHLDAEVKIDKHEH